MANDLFRSEALKAQEGERWGRPVGLLPMAWSQITWLLLIFTVCILVFLGTVSFSRKETVRGQLRTTASEARVFASEAGSILELHVRLGQDVDKGDILLKVGTDRIIDGNLTVSESSAEALHREQESLVDRQKGLERTFELEKQKNKLRLDRALQTRADAVEALELTIRQAQIAEERKSSIEPLVERGLVAAEVGRQNEQQLLDAKQNIIDLRSQITQAEITISELRLKNATIDEDLKQNLSANRERLAQIEGQLVATQSQSGYLITAPITGRIAALQVAAGDRVDPSQPVMAIMPKGEELIAELYAPSRTIAFITPGQTVRLQYDAFPYQKFGSAEGVVKAVSGAALTPNEVRGFVSAKEPVYRIVVALDRQTMLAFGKNISLQSGMELSADIILEKRKLIEWLVEPWLAASQRMSD